MSSYLNDVINSHDVQNISENIENNDRLEEQIEIEISSLKTDTRWSIPGSFSC